MSVARTPIGSYRGSLSPLTAPQLGSVAIRGAIEKSGITPDVIDKVYFGHVLQSGCGMLTARQSAIGAEITISVPCTNVNKVCASGMKSITLRAQSIVTILKD